VLHDAIHRTLPIEERTQLRVDVEARFHSQGRILAPLGDQAAGKLGQFAG
jgi:hypothetical protein